MHTNRIKRPKKLSVCLPLAVSGLMALAAGCGAGPPQQEVSSHVSATSSLAPWGGYTAIQKFSKFPHWLVLKCTFSDDRAARTLPRNLNPAITDLDTFIDLFLTLRGLGTGNVLDYYRDVSYGGMDIKTTVRGWYDAPFASNSPLGRFQRIQQCANAVPDSEGIDFSAYDGIVMVTNKPWDGGAAGVGKNAITIKNNNYQLGLVVFDSNGLYTAFAAHEVGHGLGLDHSFDNANPPVPYGDPFDEMSALNTRQFGTANYPGEGAESGPNVGAGPGLNLPNLLTLGVLPSNRLAVYTVGDSVTTFTIAALSHPDVSAPLGIKIVDPKVPNDYITIEYRESDGWDQGFGANTVLIHEFKVGGSPYSFLQRHPPLNDGLDTGMWQQGYIWVGRSYAFISKIDPGSHTATINVNSYSGSPSVTGLSPSSGTIGDTITIHGIGFSSSQGATSISFGPYAATNPVCGPGTNYPVTDCIVTVPPGSGTVDVRVTVGGTTTAIWPGDRFAYNSPAVTALSPARGPWTGGTRSTIRGRGLDRSMRVYFRGVEGHVCGCQDSYECCVESPNVGSAGPADVTVSVFGSPSATSPADVFTFTAAPVLSSLWIANDSNIGGRMPYDPPAVVGGNQAAGTPLLDGYALPGGAVISLTSSDPAAASVPATVTIGPGPQGGGSFEVTTAAVSAGKRVTITASYQGVSVSQALDIVAPTFCQPKKCQKGTSWDPQQCACVAPY